MVIRNAVYGPAQRWPDDLSLSHFMGFALQISLTISRQATATGSLNSQRQQCRYTANLRWVVCDSSISVPGTYVLICEKSFNDQRKFFKTSLPSSSLPSSLLFSSLLLYLHAHAR